MINENIENQKSPINIQWDSKNKIFIINETQITLEELTTLTNIYKNKDLKFAIKNYIKILLMIKLI